MRLPTRWNLPREQENLVNLTISLNLEGHRRVGGLLLASPLPKPSNVVEYIFLNEKKTAFKVYSLKKNKISLTYAQQQKNIP